jgi:hypothetical protein
MSIQWFTRVKLLMKLFWNHYRETIQKKLFQNKHISVYAMMLYY